MRVVEVVKLGKLMIVALGVNFWRPNLKPAPQEVERGTEWQREWLMAAQSSVRCNQSAFTCTLTQKQSLQANVKTFYLQDQTTPKPSLDNPPLQTVSSGTRFAAFYYGLLHGILPAHRPIVYIYNYISIMSIFAAVTNAVITNARSQTCPEKHY